MRSGITRFILLSVLVLMTVQVTAQQNYFVYIQTENRQPFYVKLNNKVFSSAASGYVIVPKLTDGTYLLTIGFPRNESPAVNVTVKLNKKDAGFLLRNFTGKGWGLLNLQTMEQLNGSAETNSTGTAVLSDDPFSNALSNVVDDPSIRQKEPVNSQPAIQIKEPVKEVETTAANKPAPDKISEPLVAEEVVLKPSEKNKVKIDSKILRIQRNSNEAGKMVYLDISDGKIDTVRVELFSFSSSVMNTEPVTTKPAAIQVEADKRFIPIELPNPNNIDSAAAVSSGVITEKKAKPELTVPAPKKEMINSDCKAVAKEEDFLKLRKKMAGEKNDDDMIAAAKKAFRLKCYTTAQVKSLSVFFLTDEGRYKFYDAAYPFVSDTHNFSALGDDLKDDYYLTRFKSMIRQ